MEPVDAHNTLPWRGQATLLTARLAALRRRSRGHSLSLLVPMGAEMAYRYQESIMDRTLDAIQAYLQRLDATAQATSDEKPAAPAHTEA